MDPAEFSPVDLSDLTSDPTSDLTSDPTSDPTKDQLLRLRQPDLPEPLVFGVSRLSHWFWQDYIAQDRRARHLIEQGQQLTPGFSGFLAELFHRLFADPYPPVVRSRSGDQTWARTLQDHLSQGNHALTFENLVAETQADPVSAGLATVELGEQCLQILPDLLGRSRSSPENSGQSFGSSGSSGSSSRGSRSGSKPPSLTQSLRSACEQTQHQLQQNRSLSRSFQAGWDTSQGMELQGSFRDKVALAQALRTNAYLRRIAELAGRMQQTMRIQQRTKIQQGYDQLSGLEIGNDLGRLLASELLKLADPDLFPLFAKGYLERTLLQYQKEGKESLERGPIVICVDVSGSMQGDPDLWSKAVALTLAQLAGEQQRHCRLIQFSETVKRIDDLPPGQPMIQTLLQALSEFFSGGGTNFEDPLLMALEAITAQPQLKQADLIFITDGIGHLSKPFLQQFHQDREQQGFSAYGVMIAPGSSSNPEGVAALRRFCDRIWQVSDLEGDGLEIRDLFSL